MKIKRYFAKDMRDALRKVREEQGPDAVILSNKKVDGGIEIVAAVDYEETLFSSNPVRDNMEPDPALTSSSQKIKKPRIRKAPEVLNDNTTLASKEKPAEFKSNVVWSQDPSMVSMRNEINAIRDLLENQLSGLAWGEFGKRKPLRASLIRKLSALKLKPGVVKELVSHVSESLAPDEAWRKILGILAHRIQTLEDPILQDGGIIALVGPTGVGKTTTIAKLAARFALKHGAGQVALVTTDTYRVGAVEQLRTYGKIMGVPVRVTSTEAELRSTLEDLYNYKLVLIDTAGMSQRDIRLCEQLSMIKSGSPMMQTYLVLSAVVQRTGVEEAIKAFSHIDLEGCIITKTDESSGLGGILSALIEHQLSVAYIGDGQRVPEDIQIARAHTLVSKAISLAKLSATPQEDADLEVSFGGMLADGVL